MTDGTHLIVMLASANLNFLATKYYNFKLSFSPMSVAVWLATNYEKIADEALLPIDAHKGGGEGGSSKKLSQKCNKTRIKAKKWTQLDFLTAPSTL